MIPGRLIAGPQGAETASTDLGSFMREGSSSEPASARTASPPRLMAAGPSKYWEAAL
jgi:hypothetical protein